ncbi:MAG: hypothetical protein K2X82_25725, partial [Gemmataceae bacterium]|nr:hypothetical protein [Gemmataceae bacterium]
PRNPETPPESSPGGLYAAGPPAPPPQPQSQPKTEPEPPPAGKGDAPEPRAKGSDDLTAKKPDDPGAKPPEKKDELVKTAAPPNPDRRPVGRVEGLNTLVAARADDAPNWLRLDPAGDSAVFTQDQVLALPGYKADVRLDSRAVVHLWGNLPELLPARLLEARVRFHPPPPAVEGTPGFDADLTLLAGRVYLKTAKPGGAKVRVRLAGEVWDVSLPNPDAEVAVEVATAFEPGAAYDRDGGSARVEARAAVVRGTAGLAAPDRFKSFDKVSGAVVEWNNKGGTLADPRPLEPGNSYFDKFPPVAAGVGAAVQKALADLAGRVTTREGVRLALAEVLAAADAAPPPLVQAAVYGTAAIATGPTAADDLRPLLDLLTDEGKGYARVAVVNALAAWVARDPGNTGLLEKPLAAKVGGDATAGRVLRLLRGVVSPAKPDPAELDRLVGLLNDPSVAVRELALWNLVSFADPTAAQQPGLLADVGTATGPAYDKFVQAWTARVEEVKKRPPPKK